MNFKSQSTVWDWSEQRHWQDSLTNNWRWQKKHLMLSVVVWSDRWSREEEQAFEQHSRCPCWALFLAAAQHASPSLCPFSWHCCSIKAISCPLLAGFAGGALGVTQHSRVLNSPGPSRKLVGLWSQRLLSGFAVEQINYKGNIFTLSIRNRVERKKLVNEAQKCYRIVTLATALNWPSLLWTGRS